jgi:hypothetical protein
MDETARVLLPVGVAVGAVVAVAATLGAPLLGDRWDGAALLVVPLVPLFVAQFVVVPVNQALTVLERFPTQTGLAAIRLVLTLGPFLLAHAAGASLRGALGAYSAGGAFAYAVAFVVIRRDVRSWGSVRRHLVFRPHGGGRE